MRGNGTEKGDYVREKGVLKGRGEGREMNGRGKGQCEKGD